MNTKNCFLVMFLFVLILLLNFNCFSYTIEYEYIYGDDVYTSGDLALSKRIANDDAFSGFTGTIVSGSLHPASVGNLSNLTNGIWDSNELTIVLSDIDTSPISPNPTIVIEYNFMYPRPLREITIFSGWQYSGYRSFINCKIETKHSITGSYTILIENLKTGDYGMLYQNKPTVSCVSCCGYFMDENIYGIRFSFYAVSNPFYGPKPNEFLAPGEAIIGTILKEIDVIMEVPCCRIDEWNLYK